MASSTVPDSEDEFFAMLHLIAEGRKHYAETGHIAKGLYYPNGIGQPGTRNRGERGKYYVKITSSQTDPISAPKDVKIPPMTKPNRCRSSPISLRPIQDNALSIAERVALAHAFTVDAELAPKKKLIDLTLTRNGEREKEVIKQIEVEGENVASWWDDSSSSSESDKETDEEKSVDAGDEVEPRGGTRESLKRAFSLIARKER